ncbi:MAG TPA: hypothetical protein DDY70_00805 [Clostridiales bacterium]|nr:hypothetical protein [Clostridiales bacterium]
MMYFTFRETVGALFAYLAFGFCAGLVYECLRCVIADLGLLLALIPAAWKSALLRDKAEREAVFLSATGKELSGVRREICGFVFTLLFGIFFLLLTYLALDGVFRLPMLAVTLVSFAVSEKCLGIPARRLVAAGFSRILRVLFFVLRIAFFPPKLLLSVLVERLLSPLLRKIRYTFRFFYHKKHAKREILRWRKSL